MLHRFETELGFSLPKIVIFSCKTILEILILYGIWEFGLGGEGGGGGTGLGPEKIIGGGERG